ncbi:LacI family DNA-binding transcriptional regulator [Microbacterium karelineae]|uniref:LacI family DNA-binding transcriptional regulator n=1 Tax=Microbacterium karelineae TaxID=2654283 RepID=UPI001E37ACB9|nr:LacI family DNA-binding transcriptional regulator [Microbacterium karelineae]
MARSKTGIRDVAKRAGVSVTTVSHVLNETPHTRVKDETVDRVRAAAKELGYRPNRLAQGLRTHASGMIGLVAEEIAATPHAGRILLGAQKRADADGLALAIINSDLQVEPFIPPRSVHAFLDRQVDGIVYATVYHDEVVAPPIMRGVPAVLIGARDRDGSIPSVLPDERTGAADVVRMLIEHGHRRIAFVGSSDDIPATRGRVSGYRDAMAAAEMADEARVVDDTSDAAGGYRAAVELLDSQDSPTALFCYDDRMAMGAYRAAAERGLRIPDDVSIVGFDDQAPLPTSMYPALTTVALPHYEMGEWAVETLTALLGAGGAEVEPSSPMLMPCPVIVRDSVGPPRDE